MHTSGPGREARDHVFDGVAHHIPQTGATPNLQLLTTIRDRPRIGSEIAPLRRVLVHRPGAELARLSPDNMVDLLFDDVPWPDGARAEHDAFCELMSERGIEVLRLGDLLADVAGDERARRRLIAATLALEAPAPSVARRLGWWLDGLSPEELASALVA